MSIKSDTPRSKSLRVRFRIKKQTNCQLNANILALLGEINADYESLFHDVIDGLPIGELRHHTLSDHVTECLSACQTALLNLKLELKKINHKSKNSSPSDETLSNASSFVLKSDEATEQQLTNRVSSTEEVSKNYKIIKPKSEFSLGPVVPQLSIPINSKFRAWVTLIKDATIWLHPDVNEAFGFQNRVSSLQQTLRMKRKRSR